MRVNTSCEGALAVSISEKFHRKIQMVHIEEVGAGPLDELVAMGFEEARVEEMLELVNGAALLLRPLQRARFPPRMFPKTANGYAGAV
eukprot:SAG11_NODE_10693_length_811_cov_5.359551_1_plen_88_part_00